jgi:hypothetical protein
VYAEAGATSMTVTVTPTESNGCQAFPGNPVIPNGCPVKVSVGQQFTPLTPLLSNIIGKPIVHGTVTVKTQGTGTGGTCPAT